MREVSDMLEIFGTPFPLMIALVIFFFLARPDLKKKPWIKVIRFVALGAVIVNLWTWNYGYTQKFIHGALRANAYQVTRFTKTVAVLIEQGQRKKAEIIIEKFNEHFPLVASDYQRSENLIDQLIQEAGSDVTKAPSKIDQAQ